MENGYYFYNAIQRLLLKHEALFASPEAYERFMIDLAKIFDI